MPQEVPLPLDVTTTRQLGKTPLRTTPIWWGTTALGMEDLYGYSVSKVDALTILNEIFSNRNPFNGLDTARIYGTSEDLIGETIRNHGGLPRGMLLSTKVDRDLVTGKLGKDEVRKSLHESMRRLGVDHLPLVFLHDPEHSTTPYEELVGEGGAVSELLEAQARGEIGYIGISGGPIDMLTNFVREKTAQGKRIFDAVITHNRYNLLINTAEPLFLAAAENDVAVINAAPFASGILARPDGRFAYQEPNDDIRKRVASIKAICDEYGVPLEAVALQFSLRDPRVAVTIAGVSTINQLEEMKRLAEIQIPPKLWPKIEEFRITTGDPEENRRRR